MNNAIEFLKELEGKLDTLDNPDFIKVIRTRDSLKYISSKWEVGVYISNKNADVNIDKHDASIQFVNGLMMFVTSANEFNAAQKEESK